MKNTIEFLSSELQNIKDQISQFEIDNNFDFSDFYVESSYNDLLNKKSNIERALKNNQQ